MRERNPKTKVMYFAYGRYLILLGKVLVVDANSVI